MIVYGGCIETGGVELEDHLWEAPCPCCMMPAEHGMLERAHTGSINLYPVVRCAHCGHSQGFGALVP
jgi:hypothetical protein